VGEGGGASGGGDGGGIHGELEMGKELDFRWPYLACQPWVGRDERAGVPLPERRMWRRTPLRRARRQSGSLGLPTVVLLERDGGVDHDAPRWLGQRLLSRIWRISSMGSQSSSWSSRAN